MLRIQDYIDMIFNTFEKNQVAIVPLTEGLNYEEHSTNNSSANGSDFKELRQAIEDILIYIARIVGVSPSNSRRKCRLRKAIEATNKFCFKPLTKKLERELNAKLIL